jgi:hypothetical protein
MFKLDAETALNKHTKIRIFDPQEVLYLTRTVTSDMNHIMNLITKLLKIMICGSMLPKQFDQGTILTGYDIFGVLSLDAVK